jgi:Leucine-rich repeat (LRR) protein
LSESAGFSTTLPVIVFTRPAGKPEVEWQEVDRGPGTFRFASGIEAMLRIQHIDNDALAQLVQDIAGCPAVTFLHLAENRKITDAGLEHLRHAPQLSGLNLSSCDITHRGLALLSALPRLAHLDLRYCNRLNATAIPALRSLKNLAFLDIQGTIKINHRALLRLQRKGLVIHK